MKTTKRIEKVIPKGVSIDKLNPKQPSIKPRFTLQNLFIKKKHRNSKKKRRMIAVDKNFQKELFLKTSTVNPFQLPMVPKPNPKSEKKRIKRMDFSKSK
jgi:hypothetical protein